MGNREITIDLEEYKDLIKTQARLEARVEVFAEYVNTEKYSINREVCARVFKFELEKNDDRESNAD